MDDHKLKIGDILILCAKGNDDTVFDPLNSIKKIVQTTFFFERNAYLCHDGTLFIPVNNTEDGIYCDAKTGQLGHWYSVADESSLSSIKLVYKREKIKQAFISNEDIDRIYDIIKSGYASSDRMYVAFLF